MIGATLTPWPQMRSAILNRRSVRSLHAVKVDRIRQQLRAKSESDHLSTAHAIEEIALIKQQIKIAEAALIATAGDNELLLTSIPTITLRRACLLTAAIGDVTRFPHPDKLVKYLGLAPPHRPQSGIITGRPHRQRAIDLLHGEMHMIGLNVAARPDRTGPIGLTYQRIKARSGSGRVAMWAARCHLIRIC